MPEPIEKEVKEFAIIDGKSIFYRGYFAMPNWPLLVSVH